MHYVALQAVLMWLHCIRYAQRCCAWAQRSHMHDNAKLGQFTILLIIALLIQHDYCDPLVHITMRCTLLTHKPNKQHLGDTLGVAGVHDLLTQRLSALHLKYW